MRLVLFGCCLALLVSPACGGEDERPPTFDPSGGSSGKGGSSGSGGKAGSSGTSGDAGMANEAGAGGEADAGGQGGRVNGEGAPTVRITSPEAVSDPEDPGVLL